MTIPENREGASRQFRHTLPEVMSELKRQDTCYCSAARTNMKITIPANREGASRQSAYTLPEVMMGVLIMSIMFVTLYMGFTQGFGVVQGSRENLRAIQILQDQTEVIRLYTWEQINGGYIPAQTNWTFYPAGASGQKGITYTGTVSIAAAPMTESYAADNKLLTFTLTWNTGNIQHQRQVATLVSKYGLHNYIYNPSGP
jgi:type II secretory pathway pseudopilin PulG